MHSVCLKCGNSKEAPWEQCSQCRFQPASSSEDLVKSVYLSLGRFEDDDQRDNYQSVLDELSSQLRCGQSVSFDDAELARLREQMQAVESVTDSQLAFDLLRFSLPAIVIFMALGAIYAAMLWLER